MVSLIVVVALWATLATAGVNEGLMQAAKHGDLPEVKRLVAKAAEINAKDRDGRTALMLASENGYGEVVQALLAKGADVNSKDNNGATALMLAPRKGHGEVRELLIKAGAK
jgi:ankyrin repeat protein